MNRFVRIFGRLLVIAVFLAAAYLFYEELRKHSARDIWYALGAIPASQIAIAALLTALNYLVLVGYDLLAVRWIGERLPLWKVGLASFAGYTFSHNFGATLFGTSIRYRLYSAWGVPLWKIVELLIILGLTFWFGLFALAGTLFVLDPVPLPPELKAWGMPSDSTRWLGVALLAMAVCYVGFCALHRGSLRIGRWLLPAPPFRLTIYQILIASGDLILAAAVLYHLLPPVEGLGYLRVLGVFMLSYVAVVLTHVPGGYGVLEIGILRLLPEEHGPAVIAALLIFRVVYFWAPLVISASLLAVHEFMLTAPAPRSASEKECATEVPEDAPAEDADAASAEDDDET
ncbi:MAG: lysylphosphatidylglycerol synthase transmembrane domain-containing protein [Planctomycetota bacterium]